LDLDDNEVSPIASDEGRPSNAIVEVPMIIVIRPHIPLLDH